jgi:hypothetical protein
MKISDTHCENTLNSYHKKYKKEDKVTKLAITLKTFQKNLFNVCSKTRNCTINLKSLVLYCVSHIFIRITVTLTRWRLCSSFVGFTGEFSMILLINVFINCLLYQWYPGGRRDHIVVGFTTTCTISAYDHYCCKFEPH